MFFSNLEYLIVDFVAVASCVWIYLFLSRVKPAGTQNPAQPNPPRDEYDFGRTLRRSKSLTLKNGIRDDIFELTQKIFN